MKKILTLFLLLLLALPAAAEESGPPSFLAITHLDEMLQSLQEGKTIERLYYTDGFGFSTSEFTTENPEEIAAILDALTAITLTSPANEFVTDWYPQIVFFLSDGSHYNVCFNVRNLEIGGMEMYTLAGDAEFWRLTAGRTAENALY